MLGNICDCVVFVSLLPGDDEGVGDQSQSAAEGEGRAERHSARCSQQRQRQQVSVCFSEKPHQIRLEVKRTSMKASDRVFEAKVKLYDEDILLW